MKRAGQKYLNNGFSLTVVLSEEMGFQLKTIAFQMGLKGKYSKAMRNILATGIEAYLAKLSDKEKREYDQIMENVRLNQQMEEINKAPG